MFVKDSLSTKQPGEGENFLWLCKSKPKKYRVVYAGYCAVHAMWWPHRNPKYTEIRSGGDSMIINTSTLATTLYFGHPHSLLAATLPSVCPTLFIICKHPIFLKSRFLLSSHSSLTFSLSLLPGVARLHNYFRHLMVATLFAALCARPPSNSQKYDDAFAAYICTQTPHTQTKPDENNKWHYSPKPSSYRPYTHFFVSIPPRSLISLPSVDFAVCVFITFITWCWLLISAEHQTGNDVSSCGKWHFLFFYAAHAIMISIRTLSSSLLPFCQCILYFFSDSFDAFARISQSRTTNEVSKKCIPISRPRSTRLEYHKVYWDFLNTFHASRHSFDCPVRCIHPAALYMILCANFQTNKQTKPQHNDGQRHNTRCLSNQSHIATAT